MSMRAPGENVPSAIPLWSERPPIASKNAKPIRTFVAVRGPTDSNDARSITLLPSGAVMVRVLMPPAAV